jgi:hypothetical protein
MKNAVFWDVEPCWTCTNRRFGGTRRLHHQGDSNRLARNNDNSNYQLLLLRSVLQLLVTVNFVPRTLIWFTLMMVATCSSETSAHKEPHGVTYQMTVFFNYVT